MTTPFPFVAGAVLTAQQLNDITNLPINDQTASYVLVVGDAGKRVIMNVASANTVTVNNSIFTAGDTVEVLNKGAGATTITAGAGVTINSASGLVVSQYQSGKLIALSASSFLFLETDVTVTSGVIQVKSTTKTDTFTTTSSSMTDVTGLSVTITPTSASNLILVNLSLSACGPTGSAALQGQLVRGSTAIALGDTAGSRTQTTINNLENPAPSALSLNVMFLDSPATTSATTYKLQIRSNSSPATVFVNRSSTDTDNNQFARSISTITAMEVAP